MSKEIKEEDLIKYRFSKNKWLHDESGFVIIHVPTNTKIICTKKNSAILNCFVAMEKLEEVLNMNLKYNRLEIRI